MTLNELLDKINHISAEFYEKIALHQYEPSMQLIEDRMHYIEKIVALYPLKMQQSELISLLKRLQKQEAALLHTLNEQRDKMKNTLTSFHQLRHYFNV